MCDVRLYSLQSEIGGSTGSGWYHLPRESNCVPICAHQPWCVNCLPAQINPQYLKDTHARDFHSLFVHLFLHLSNTNRYKTQYNQHFWNFRSLPDFAESAKHNLALSAKRGVKFSVVFVTVRFRIVLSVFSEKGESNFAFSAKARSSWRKRRVKLCAFGSIKHIQRRSGITRFRRISGVKRSVAVFAKTRLCTRILHFI
jgi:hypothetical protein